MSTTGGTPTETRFAPVNGAMIAHDSTGDGPPLLLVHAGIADRRMWNAQVPALSRQYRVIRYDARGFGETIKQPEDFSPVGDLLGLLDHLELTRVALLGCSMGAKTALEAAVSAPERVSALIVSGALLGVPYSDMTLAAWEDIEALAESGDIAGAVERELRMWVDGPRRTPDMVNPAIRELVRDMETNLFSREDQTGDEQRLNPPVAERLTTITAPTLVLWGDQDIPEVIQTGELLADALPGAKSRVIANTAHLPNLEQPDLFNQIVLDFLDRSPAAETPIAREAR